MHPRVFVVLATSDGAAYLPATLAALDEQTVAPTRVVAVDGGSRDGSRALLEASTAHTVLQAPRLPYGALVAKGVASLPSAEDGDWLWLLAHDAVPHPRALQSLLAHVEASPSVAVVGPKVMRADDPHTFAAFGETLTPAGSSVLLHAGELDQGQRDADTDRLGVAASGMLVRRDVFAALEGFDPVLRSIDAGLDLGIRARLAGHRVAVEPRARVRSAGGPEHFSRRSLADAQRVAIARRAQLHRRLAYANPLAVILHWLLLVPLALARSVWHLLVKRPAAIAGEWRATLGALVELPSLARARRRIRRTRVQRWSQLRPLRTTWRAVRERRRSFGDPDTNRRLVDERVGFVEGAGLWVAALAAVVGVVFSPQLIGAASATGGALLPLDGSLGTVWSAALAGPRDALGEIVAPADGFAIVLALLATTTPWAPGLSIVVLLMTAPMLASITAFFAVRRLSTFVWAPALGALVWSLAPTLLVALGVGRIGPVIAHILLPLAVVSVLQAHRSWRTAGVAGLALAATAASAPSLLPAIVLLTVLAAGLGWRAPLRPLAALVPALALTLPVATWQWRRGTPLAALADPGVPMPNEAPNATAAALTMPEGGLAGMRVTAETLGLGFDPVWIAVAVLVPLLVLALLGMVLRAAEAAPWLVIAALGFATAVASGRLELTSLDGTPVSVWAGSGASLELLGLLGMAAAGLEVARRRASLASAALVLASIAAALPMIAVSFLSPAVVIAGPERRMPAFVSVAAETSPHVGTLVLRPLADGVLGVRVERGAGRSLEFEQTAVTTSPEFGALESEVAAAAVNLASGGDVEIDRTLDDAGVAFVLLQPERAGGTAVHDRAQRSLDARGDLEAIGQTEFGLLWQRTDAAPPAAMDRPQWAGWLLAAQLLALAASVVAAMPNLGKGRVRSRRGTMAEEWS